MFGIYRLILACLVALSHYGLVRFGCNPGQWAVLSFYVLSGFLMENQFHKLATARRFYVDRFLRIYPMFAAVLIFATLFENPSAWTLLINILLLPLDYASLTKVPVLVGPSWSLACEAHFYLLVPLLARMSTVGLRGLALGSAGLFAVSPFLPQSIFLTYQGLPGILFAFLTGMLIKRRDVKFLRGIWLIFFVLLLLFIYSKASHSKLLTGIHINVCLGFLTAVPLVSWLATLNPRVTWDQRLGLLSYPLFLVHLPLYYLVAVHVQHLPMLGHLALALAAAGLLVVLVELPFDKIRYQWRKQPPELGPRTAASR